MSEVDRVGMTISYTFFAAQLGAISLYGGASAIVMFRASDPREGLVIALLIVAMIAAVVGFRLPRYFASKLSGRVLSFLAITFSTLALIAALVEARSYVGLPESLISSPGVLQLQSTANLGAAVMGLALVINLVAAILAPKRAQEGPSINPGS